MTMTREQAIRYYVELIIGGDLAYLIRHMNAYDGSFDDCVYYDMAEFDELMSNCTPMEIAQMIYFGEGFNPNDDYFRFNGYGNLESADGDEVVAEAEYLKDDVIDHLTYYYSGDTPWSDLDYIVDSDATALFNEDFEEVDEEEEEDQ